MKVKKYSLLGGLFFVSLLLTTKIMADPPFISNNPAPLDAKQMQIYLYGTLSKLNPTTIWLTPAIEIDYGVFNDFEVDFITGLAGNAPKKLGNSVGLGDSQIQITYRFNHESTYLPDIALNPVILLPTGNSRRRLGNGTPWLQLNLWLQKTWSDWSTYGGGGYTINPAKNARNFYDIGWVLVKTLNKTWTVGTEIYSQGSVTAKSSSFTLLNLGAYYNFNDNFAFLFSVGHSFIGISNTVAYAGVTWVMDTSDKKIIGIANSPALPSGSK